MKLTKVLIATPFYETKAFSPYVTSLVSTTTMLQDKKIKFGYLAMSGDAYIWRVRNTICNQFLDDTDASHLMFLDSDMAWQASDFFRLLQMGEKVDIVGSAYAIKNELGKYTTIPLTDPSRAMVRNEDGLLLSATVGSGFLLIARPALEKITAAFPDHYYIDSTAVAGPEGEKPDRKWKDFFGHVRVNEVMLGEDYSFCFRANQAKVAVWTMTDVPIIHFGVGSWPGFYEELLLRVAPDGKLPEDMQTWKSNVPIEELGLGLASHSEVADAT